MNKVNLIVHVDDNTLEWWGKQDAKIREEALGDEDPTPLLDFIKQLNKFCVGLDELWCPRSHCLTTQYYKIYMHN